MQWTLPELPESVLPPFVVASVAIALVGITRLSKRPNLNAIPTVGPSGLLGSWLGAIKFVTNAADLIQEGYEKHKGAPFKIATPHRWIVILSSRAHIEELRTARTDEFLSMVLAFEELSFEHTVGLEVIHNAHHASVIRSQLTRNLGVLFPELQNEIVTAFDDILDLKDNEWKNVPALSSIQHVVCRASNRVLVGLPLCRNPSFLALNIQYAIDVIAGGFAVGLFPKVLKPLAARFITNIPKNVRQGKRLLRPVIEERQRCLQMYGDEWTDKPRDFLSWLMDDMGPSASVEALTRCVLAANFAAVHSASEVFTNALYNLAANPQYVEPLREEVESIVKEHGWSKESLGRMRKVDSFVRESIRMDSISVLGLTRQANEDFTFSDGTFIPKGTRVDAPVRAIHYDDALYKNPEAFNAFRFAGMDVNSRFVTTSPMYLSFGHGRHACPGRYFAAVELKTMLAHVVTTYDVKLDANTTRPRNSLVGPWNITNHTAKVMFRRRVFQNGIH